MDTMEGIEITTNMVGARRDVALLRAKGYIDTQTCGHMLKVITDVLKEKVYHIIVDMGAVNYVSSAGWGVFVGEIKGIRESGGDLKIVQMLPEVNEIFQMLEFNRILSCYDNIEEAINDFDLSIGLDITKSVSRTMLVKNGKTKSNDEIEPAPSHHRQSGQTGAPRKRFEKGNVNESMLPLSEQIKIVVIDDPVQSIWKIKKNLNTARFGYRKVGFLKLYSFLRKASLNSKEKRIRFYRSR